jgi:hypothetical protein
MYQVRSRAIDDSLARSRVFRLARKGMSRITGAIQVLEDVPKRKLAWPKKFGPLFDFSTDEREAARSSDITPRGNAPSRKL